MALVEGFPHINTFYWPSSTHLGKKKRSVNHPQWMKTALKQKANVQRVVQSPPWRWPDSWTKALCMSPVWCWTVPPALGAGNSPCQGGGVNVDHLHPKKEDASPGGGKAENSMGRIKRTWTMGNGVVECWSSVTRENKRTVWPYHWHGQHTGSWRRGTEWSRGSSLFSWMRRYLHRGHKETTLSYNPGWNLLLSFFPLPLTYMELSSYMIPIS